MSTKTSECTRKDINLIEGLRVDIVAANQTTQQPPANHTLQTQREGETTVDRQTVRCRGVVKWFNPTKGFGFITPEDGGADVFVHQSEIQLGGFRSLAQGEYVEYNLLNGEKGPKALSVTGPEGAPPKGAPRQHKVIFMDGDKTYFASDNKKVQSLLIGNQIPVYTSLTSLPYAGSNHYVKRNVQYSPLSPKQIGFVHSPVQTTHNSFHFYNPSRDYPAGNNWPVTPPSSKIVDPNSPVASPQFHFPVTQHVPLSPTFATSGYSNFSYPAVSPPHYTNGTYGYTPTGSHDLITQGLNDLSISNSHSELPSYQ